MADRETVNITVSYRDIEVPISLSVSKKQATTLREGTRVAAAVREALLTISAEKDDEETS